MSDDRLPLLRAVFAVFNTASSRLIASMAQARVAVLPKLLKYVGYCLAAAGSAALIRSRCRATLAARARRAPTLKFEKGCLNCKSSQISVFSMNILSQSLVSKQRYKYCPSKYLDWEYRLERLISLIETVCSRWCTMHMCLEATALSWARLWSSCRPWEQLLATYIRA